MFKSDSEQARLSERPPASAVSALLSSTEVLADPELASSRGFPAVSSSAGKIVQNEHKIRGEIKDKINLAQKQDEHWTRDTMQSGHKIQRVRNKIETTERG